MLTRRLLVAAGGLFAAGLTRADGAVVEIQMRSTADGGNVGFDPVGLLIQPGQTLRWICEANYHTAAAYHPANADHSLRIPRAASPFASDVLQPGEHFDVTLTVPGVYDYFCAPHEQAGMVGRIVVGAASGPGSLPFDWFKGQAEARDWLPVPPAARAVFPATAEIVRRTSVPGASIAMGGMRHGGRSQAIISRRSTSCPGSSRQG
jgi:plastocyanin